MDQKRLEHASKSTLLEALLFRLAHALFLISLAVPAVAEWQSVGTVTASKPQGNQITFRSPKVSVIVAALTPDLIRVRLTRLNSPATDASWAVVKTDWPRFHLEINGDKSSRVLRTAELEVRVQLTPFRVSFYDAGGRLIAKDAENLGVAWDGERVRSWKWMPQDEHYFGLGEKGGPLDRRGHAFVMWNTDAYAYDSNTDPLYVTVPFFIGLRNGRAYGIFFDNTSRSSFDMGTESPDYYSFGAEEGELDYYFFYGPDPKKVLERYTELVGRMPLPARWALGYHQSRYSYYPESAVRFIAENFRQRRIPCDAIFLDIHYMDGYRVFTWDKSRFPNPPRLLSDMRAQGFRVVTIVDPGVKVDPDYWVYQQGLGGGAFVKKPDGKVFIGKVWPGEGVFPDFTAENVRTWWGSLYKNLLDAGVAGIWNDMNEPALFDIPTKTMDPDVIHEARGLRSSHAKVHNVYGMLMSAATREGLLRLRPNERPLVITRATYAGGQRYAAVWTGDNSSTWEHLRLSLPMLMGMGLSGLTLVGADIGGFVASPTPELYTRWLEAGVFYPYCRTHTDLESRAQEPWSFGDRWEAINRRTIELRYRLLPYLYNAFQESAESGLPVMRPLLVDYLDDATAVGQNEEFLFGDDLLVAPVVKPEEVQWRVYLPRGAWYDFWTDRRYEGPGSTTVDAPLERIPIFVRGGAIVPTQQMVQYVEETPVNPLTLEIYPEGNSSREYYEDDGVSFDYQRGGFLRQRFTVAQADDGLSIGISAREGSYTPPPRSLVLKVHGQRTRPRRVDRDGKGVGFRPSSDALGEASEGWTYEEERHIVWTRVPDTGAALTIKIEK